MLSHKVLTRQDINRAASYYEDSADDYYAKDGKSSQWQGKGAKFLKLSGPVDKVQLRQLMAGNVDLNEPNSSNSTRSATREDSNQRIGIDFTFSAPKSVSMQALIAMDDNIIKAHDKAVANTLKVAENHAQARKKINKKSYLETTGNLIVAKFRHETSRERDPQLHTHAIIMNLTRREDNEWRALRNDEIIKMTKYLGGVYRAELASQLKKIGYQLRYERQGLFELDHISRAQLEGFSNRSKQIEEKLEAQGLSRKTASTKQKQQATMESRKHKVLTEREIIFNDWKDKAKTLGINFDWQKTKESLNKNDSRNSDDRIDSQTDSETKAIKPDRFTKEQAAKRAVSFAINHLTERQAIMNDRSLIDAAVKQAVGSALLVDVKRELAKQIKGGYLVREDSLYVPLEKANSEERKTREGWIAELINEGMKKTKATAYVRNAIRQGSLIKLEPRYTTKTILSRERHILRSELQGRGAVSPIVAELKLDAKSRNLNQQQFEAVKLISTTTNRIVGIQGFAGTGKTHMLKCAKAIIEENGYNLQAIAPYGSQVKALQQAGVKAVTAASFLKAKNKNIDSRTILVLDEAGVVPTRLMEQTLRLVEKSNARIVLIGDIAQTKAIEAGKPFQQLQKAGMETVLMDQIQRQKDQTLKKAVELAAKGQLNSSLKHINNIVEIQGAKERHLAIANDYLKLSETKRNNTIVVSGTNEARHNINQNIRQGLNLAGHGIKTDTLVQRDLTKAESKYAKNYYIGDIIKPERDYVRSGLKSTEFYKIEEIGPSNHLTVRSKTGEDIKFSPMAYRNISVYQPKSIEISPNDLVRVTCNDKKLNLVNGDRFKVEAIKSDHMLLTDGKRQIKLATNKPLHIDYAYATTIHSSQGLDADRVLIDADTKSPTVTKDVYYVAISRARLEARIYTNSMKELPQAIVREHKKSAAIELIKNKNLPERAKSYRSYEK